MDLNALFVLTPAGECDPTMAIAACRAGAKGTLDLEYASSIDDVSEALNRLGRFAQGEFGVKLGVRDASVLEHVLQAPPESLGWVLLSGGIESSQKEVVSRIRKKGLGVYFEATSVLEMDWAEELDVDGIILKGNESGGRVGDETAFVLLQRWQHRLKNRTDAKTLPVWIQGGIGLNTAAACAAAGAAGVVLDGQLLLTRESTLPPQSRKLIAAFDGGDTLCLGAQLGESYRIHKRPGSKAVEELTKREQDLIGSELSREEKLCEWRQAIRNAVETAPVGQAVFLGQDACLAASLAEENFTVSGVLQAVVERVRKNLDSARDLQPLAENSPFAESHGIRFPILQGPMTRVSDTAEFANSVAEAGALPFLALSLLRKNAVVKLLDETKKLVGDKPWGAGLLGFLPPEIRKEQMSALLANKPPFALIAGGRPDQAKELEDQGVPTYLHVPSPGLLTMFLKDGAKRFVFEGRECGGHVGPRGSFLLWETMCGLLLNHLGEKGRGEDLHVVFAGGIHDDVSCAAVAAMSAPLAERGVNVAVLMGTAYLFTKEAVDSGAIVKKFQEAAVSSGDTVLLETGPGHAIRCINTPYFEHFNAEKRRLQKEGKTPEEITRALEWMNMGRLRVASKGLERQNDETGASKLANVSDDDQLARGMYMIGQVAAMHDRVLTMQELHETVCLGGMKRIDQLKPTVIREVPQQKPSDIAIVGMASFYPRSISVEEYWENILNKTYAVTEVPDTHWDWRLYYDPDPRAPDKSISKWGGFMGDVPFEPMRYGITPKSVKSIEPLQLLLLEGVRHAINDAGYENRPFNREKTCAVVGIGGGGAPLSVAYGFRACLPLFSTVPGLDIDHEQLVEKSNAVLPEWTEDSFPGFLNNVTVGRVSNRFNFAGKNMAIDAACASSLAALYDCVWELESGTSDVAFAMGADAVMTPFAFTAFSKTHALSARGQCSPFDAAGDGIALSEGVGIVMLKRLEDAERDGDTIYSVIKGVGSSSDGREKGLTAPNHSGQVRALKRAYEKANISPERVGLVEAHGTGTVVGDHTEAKALIEVFREGGADIQSTALGSVKSMIGHTKCAAGVAGLIKSAKALHHKVLPPTLVERPNPKINFEDSPLYLNSDPRPWVHGGPEPRCAGVSAFGFGGTNFHTVLEEYVGEYREETPPAMRHWPAELLVWRRGSKAELLKAVEKVNHAISTTAVPVMGKLAATLWKANTDDASHPTLAIIASTVDDLKTKLPEAIEKLNGDDATIQDPRGIYFAEKPADSGGKVAFLFPGQGSQYPNMLSQVGMNFPEVRRTFDNAERTLYGTWSKPLGRFIYPPSTFTPEEDKKVREALANTEVAQPALGASGLGMFRLLEALGIEPDFVAGHSYGEYVALCAAGVISEEDLFRISYERGRLINEAAGEDAGSMVAIDADADEVAKLIEGIEGVWLANLNSPTQTVVSGTAAGLKELLAKLQEKKVRGRQIPVACAFHSELVADAARPLAKVLSDTKFRSPKHTVFSNTLGEAYPNDGDAIASILADHLASSVQWRPEVEAMHKAGARVFIEVGPQGVLTNLVKQTLGDAPHIAVPTDLKGRAGLVQFQHCLAQLLVSGVPMDLGRLYRDREPETYELSRLEKDASIPSYSPMTWMVNGVRSRLHNEPEPYVLGQPMKDRLPSATGGSPPPPSNGSAPKNGAASAASSSSATNGHAHTNGASQPAAETNGHHPEKNGHANGHSNGHAYPAPAAPQPPAQLPAQPQPAQLPMQYGPAMDEATVVMQGFQNVMGKFLDTQRSVMLAYMQGDAGEPIPAASYPAQPVMMPQPQPQYAPAPQPQAYQAPAPQPQPVPQPAPVAAAPAPAPAAPAPAPEPKAEAKPAAETGLAKVKEPVVAESAPAASSGLSRESMADQLLDLVSERTGYPKDMLGLDLDLEGELGIDSIKRVEILGTLAEGISAESDADMEDALDLEQLTSLRTLRGILDYLDEALVNPTQPALSAEDTAGSGNEDETSSAAGMAANGSLNDQSAPTESEESATGEIQRGLVQLVDAPLPSGAGAVVPSGTVIVTDDGRGIAPAVAAKLADFDVNVAIVRMSGEGSKGWTADLTDPEEVEDLLKRIREEAGSLGGLIHLMPLAEIANDGGDWAERAHRNVKSLFVLSKAIGEELRIIGEDGGAFILSATGLGGTIGFGDDHLPTTASAGDGAVIGFTKTLGSEWPEVMVRAVDLDPTEDPAELADHLLNELNDPEGPLEVGHRGAKRVTWEPIRSELDTTVEPEMELPSGATILVTGGARGITARIVEELAKRHQPNVVIVGRSELPSAEEEADTVGIEGQMQIKAALIQRFKASGKDFKPVDIEKTYQQLLRDRELRENLAKIEAAGATIHYRACDVRDADGIAALFKELENQFGGIDGVIHGAGVIDDKFIKDKQPESFDRVFLTKVDSVSILLKHLNPERLKFCVFFASIASRYGNRGQADYAAANEVLSKLAFELDRQWKARVTAICWGPWGEVGMASHLEKHFVKRGLFPIPPQVGSRMLADELLFGKKGEAEILVAGGEEHEFQPRHSRQHPDAQPATAG